MENNKIGNDALAHSPQILSDQIRRSHRFLRAQLYTSLLYIISIVGLVYLIWPIQNFSMPSPIMFVFLIIFIKPIKEAVSFYHSSGRYFREVEHSSSQQAVSGLTKYIKHLSKFLQTKLYSSGNPNATLTESLDSIDSHIKSKKGLYTFIMELVLSGSVVVAFVIFLITATNTGSISPEVLNHPLLYVVLGSFFIAPVIRWRLSGKWRLLVTQWVHGVQIAMRQESKAFGRA